MGSSDSIRRPMRRILAFLIAFSSLVQGRCAESQPPAADMADAPPFARRVPAPSFEGGLEWINTTKPLTLADLRGKFVLVDFWTFCCINCLHVLPELKQLERAYPNELVVIGVHSAKFSGERDIENIREAVLRYEIEHPVVNDANMTIWNRYGAQSWPTLVLIDPAGEAVWVGGGERTFEDLRDLIERGLPYYRKNGLLTPGPATFVVKPEPSNTPLRFPGKVLADAAGNRLFISDSNHNRIVICDLLPLPWGEGWGEGALRNHQNPHLAAASPERPALSPGERVQLQAIIGSGAIGHDDGEFAAASFHHPQGMALVGDDLYVADTENHRIRKVDLAARQVTTVAGTGEQGDGFPGPLPDGRFIGPPASTALNSPWALWPFGQTLYIAMAGPHQIWKMSLAGGEIGPYAGNGREDIVDGPLLSPTPYAAGYASFAQPSGLASDGMRLFVADSEGSAIRAVPFDPGGHVKTIVGVLGSLFDFGDVDGVYPDARLQHPLGIAFHDGQLYVADTYNNKIKVIDVAAQSCRRLAGSGKVGGDDAADGRQASFNEPAGLSVAGGKLFVADTNNHAIRVVELTPPYRVSTLVIDGLAAP